jgi:F0F1-type ATP synthase membrane subunit b/b'
MMSETEQQNMEKQPSIVSKDGESVNKGETSENVENIGVETGDYDIDNIHTKENIANTEIVNTAEDESTERPKHKTKTLAKPTKNRIQSDKAKLEKSWEKAMKSISQLHDAPNSVNKISEAISQVRSDFNIYQEAWLLFADYLTYAGTPQCLEEFQRLESIISNHKQFVHENIAQANQRKEEILLEMRSMRSGSESRASSMSSTALRVRARAKAAEAMKRAELQKKRLIAESQSALELQQKELALARHKLDEQARPFTLKRRQQSQ